MTDSGNTQLRICMPTLRRGSREAFRAAVYEAEDVLAATADVDFLELEAGPAYHFWKQWNTRLLVRKLHPAPSAVQPGLRRVSLQSDYDAFIVVCQNIWDLPCVNAIRGWQERCRTSICWISEIWVSEIKNYPGLIRSLQQFDHVFVSSQGTAGPLSEFLGRSCVFVPPGVDALTFSPLPANPARSVDVYSMGRRWAGVHEELLRAAGEDKMFYIFDTVAGMADKPILCHRQHRRLIASIAKRSRIFLVAPGKMDTPDQTWGQMEIGYRYFEAMAAGTVMVGQAAKCDAFDELFPWPDAVVEIQTDGRDTREILAQLSAMPERLDAISRRNAVEGLLRHDWVHRWKSVFEGCGLAQQPGMNSRELQLTRLAEQALQQPRRAG